MKKRISKLFCVVLSVMLMVVTVFSVPAFANTATPISTKEELNNIRNNRAGNYYLTCDIVFTAEDFMVGGDFYNNGKGFTPLSTNSKSFSGTFDGNGYSIKGLQISVEGLVYTISTTPITASSSSGSTDDEGWTGDYPIPPSVQIPDTSPVVGLFGNNTGTIKNLFLEDAIISGNATNGAKMYIGGITGHNNGTVSNCAVKATFSGSSATYVGGVVGYQSSGSVDNCVSHINITSGGRTAGIAGAVAAGSVTMSYSVANSKAAVAISNNTSTVSAYYVADADADGIGTRIATENANNAEQFEGFDFETVWYMDATVNMPWLSNMRFVVEPINPDAPSAPVAGEVTATTIILVATEGYEYSIDGNVWQTSNVFENLTPGTEYTLYQRVAETDINYASEISDALTVSTIKFTMDAPSVPVAETVDYTTVTLVATEGYEYSIDGNVWQTSNVFENLTQGTVYTFYQRIAETEVNYASEASEALTVKTLSDHIPGDINDDGDITLDDVVALAQYVAGWDVEIVLDVADVNRDGDITLDDVVLLAQYVAGWDVEL